MLHVSEHGKGLKKKASRKKNDHPESARCSEVTTLSGGSTIRSGGGKQEATIIFGAGLYLLKELEAVRGYGK